MIRVKCFMGTPMKEAAGPSVVVMVNISLSLSLSLSICISPAALGSWSVLQSRNGGFPRTGFVFCPNDVDSTQARHRGERKRSRDGPCAGWRCVAREGGRRVANNKTKKW